MADEKKTFSTDEEIAEKQAVIRKVERTIKIAMYVGIVVILVVLAVVACKTLGILGMDTFTMLPNIAQLTSMSEITEQILTV